jgi:hypothetical protein
MEINHLGLACGSSCASCCWLLAFAAVYDVASAAYGCVAAAYGCVARGVAYLAAAPPCAVRVCVLLPFYTIQVTDKAFPRMCTNLYPSRTNKLYLLGTCSQML